MSIPATPDDRCLLPEDFDYFDLELLLKQPPRREPTFEELMELDNDL